MTARRSLAAMVLGERVQFVSEDGGDCRWRELIWKRMKRVTKAEKR